MAVWSVLKKWDWMLKIVGPILDSLGLISDGKWFLCALYVCYNCGFGCCEAKIIH